MTPKHAQPTLLLALPALLILPSCSSTGTGNARDAAAEAGRDVPGSSEPGPESGRDSAVAGDRGDLAAGGGDTAGALADQAASGTEVASDQASDPTRSPDTAEVRLDAGAFDAPADRGPSLPDAGLDQGIEVSSPADAAQERTLDAAGLEAGAADRPAPDGGGAPSLPEICTLDGWCWANPLPHGLAIDGIDGTASDDYWAVGQSGIVLHFDGAGWQRIDAGITKYLSCVRAFARDDVWLGGEAGLSHFDGTSFAVVDPGFSGWVMALAGTSSEDLWAATDADTIGHRTAAGWSIVPSQATYASPWSMFALSPSDAWAAGPSGYLRHWDGEQWTAVDGAYETYAVWGTSSSDVWMGGNDGEMYHWDGQSLAKTTFPTAWLTSDIWGSSATDVWATVSYSPSIGQGLSHLLHYDGNQWNDVDPKGTPSRLHGSAANDIWAVGRGSLQHFDGAAWSPRLSVTDNTLMGMWAHTDGDAFAVDSAGRALHWDGSHWSAAQTPASFLSSVAGTAADDVWAAGTSVVHFDGSAWTTVLASIGYVSSAAVWAAGRDDVWVGFDGSFFRHFNGGTFEYVTSATGAVVRSIWGSGPSDVWAVGAGTQHWDGAKWTRVDAGNGTSELRALSGSASNNVWAAGDGGKVVRWNGLGWSAVTSPTSQDLYGIWVAGPSEVYVTVWSGQIWFWNGSTWTAQDSGVGDRPPFQLNGMAGAGSRIWAFGNSGILVTKRR